MEFAILMERAKAKGLRPADIGRMLHVTDARMSQLMAGYPPTARFLADLRVKVLEMEVPKGIHKAESHKALVDQLTDLLQADPAGYEAAKLTIGALHSRMPRFRFSGKEEKPLSDDQKIALQASKTGEFSSGSSSRKPHAGRSRTPAGSHDSVAHPEEKQSPEVVHPFLPEP